ncbi:hypothetical protein F4805DRAFT_422732 [Annulohypoxylon moriforme]|nr:hypothetical protein F4805DRAFT_422732 [Annulohypoxylon moriforme]
MDNNNNGDNGFAGPSNAGQNAGNNGEGSGPGKSGEDNPQHGGNIKTGADDEMDIDGDNGGGSSGYDGDVSGNIGGDANNGDGDNGDYDNYDNNDVDVNMGVHIHPVYDGDDDDADIQDISAGVQNTGLGDEENDADDEDGYVAQGGPVVTKTTVVAVEEAWGGDEDEDMDDGDEDIHGDDGDVAQGETVITKTAVVGVEEAWGDGEDEDMDDGGEDIHDDDVGVVDDGEGVADAPPVSDDDSVDIILDGGGDGDVADALPVVDDDSVEIIIDGGGDGDGDVFDGPPIVAPKKKVKFKAPEPKHHIDDDPRPPYEVTEEPTEEDSNRFMYQYIQYTTRWYSGETRALDGIEIYTPQQRQHTNPYLLNIWPELGQHNDWYFRNGIPHELSAPGNARWQCLKVWMLEVARGWWGPSVEYPRQNPDLFRDIYNRGQVNFFRVARSRIDRQVQYAFWTRFARRRQRAALSIPYFSRTIRNRQEFIMFSLTGSDGYMASGDDSLEVETLARFIRSPAVWDSWIEYRNDYLLAHPDSSNARWNMIQPTLHNRDFPGSMRRAYGRGGWNERRDLDKTDWTHEDHAMRFIISVHNVGTAQLLDAGFGPDDGLSGWRACFFKKGNFPDIEDRYWFGFSLLNLLVLSWQHNRQHPSELYRQRLVPALYKGFEPKKASFPDVEVGMVNLDPKTPWIVYPEYRAPFDFPTGESMGIVNAFEGRELYEQESETERADNGGRLPRDD